MDFTRIAPTEITDNMFKAIGKDWMLVAAGDREKMNMLTASWGGAGILWGKPVTFCFIRPTRYTLGFMERGGYYTLSFFEEGYREALNLCGTKSGRDIDKVEATGLTPVYAPCGVPYFQEARLVLVCRKLYEDELKHECFLDQELDDSVYPQRDYHKVFVGEIIEVLKK